MKYSILIITLLILTNCNSKKKAQKSADETIPKIEVLEDYKAPKDNDPYSITNAQIEGDLIKIKVEYSGGCEEHNFRLITSRMFMKSLPPKLGILLVHDNGGDACRELKKETLTFDLKSARYPGQDKDYTIILMLDDWKNSLEYKY